MFEELRRLLSRAAAEYTDLRYEVKRETRITFRNRELAEVSSNVGDGHVVRLLKSGGFATVAFSRLEDAESALSRAQANAELLGRHTLRPVRLARAEVAKDSYSPVLDIDPSTVPLDAKIDLLRRYAAIPLQSSRIAAVEVEYTEAVRRKYIASTEGTEVREDATLNQIVASILARDGTRTQRVRVGIAHGDGFKGLLSRESDFQNAAGLASELVRARASEPGTYRVLIDPELSGVFLHEVFGHTSEADSIEDMPSARERLQIGARLGSELLNVSDDPTLSLPLGHYRYDDEGVAVRPTQILKDGVLVGRLHSRRTAAAFGEPLTGHCVAEDYRYAPIVRMGCIALEPGSESRDELLARLGDGLYLCGELGGETAQDEFSFDAQYGYVVKDGRRVQMIRDVKIVGSLDTTLNSVLAVGRDLRYTEFGGCGKCGQVNLRSAWGAPHVLIDRVLISG